MAAVSDALLVLFGEITRSCQLGDEGELFSLPVNPGDYDPGAEVRLGDVVGAVLADEPGEGKVLNFQFCPVLDHKTF